METLEQLSQKVQQAFNAYGSKLGIDLPYRKLTESYRLNCYYNTTALLIVIKDMNPKNQTKRSSAPLFLFYSCC